MYLLLEWICWISLIVVFYTYVGYGILAAIIVRIKGRSVKPMPFQSDADLPEVALVICAYNEEDIIEQKIINSREIDYPANKLRIIVVSDGSTDHTHQKAQQLLGENALFEPRRGGKVAAMNRVVPLISESLIVFCDANTFLNANSVRALVRYFQDPLVGAVAGEKKIEMAASGKAVTSGEGFYWKYESLLKSIDAGIYSVVGAAGELFSIRRNLYQPTEGDVIIEDFVLSLRVCLQGYKVAYAPDAYAIESGSAEMKEEQKRKVRICAGGFQAIGRLKKLLNPFRNPWLTFSYLSHRVFRWTVAPLGLLLLLISNICLVVMRAGWIYDWLLIGQALFYLVAVLGWVLSNKNLKIKALSVPYYFLFMNVSAYLGFFKFLNGKQSVLWEKSRRLDSGISRQI
ncbi:MAG: glycosyltransferase family 2 protein [Flavihumibacter sp.]